MNSRCNDTKRSKPYFEMVALASFWWAGLRKNMVLVDKHPLEFMYDGSGIHINDIVSRTVRI